MGRGVVLSLQPSVTRLRITGKQSQMSREKRQSGPKQHLEDKTPCALNCSISENRLPSVCFLDVSGKFEGKCESITLFVRVSFEEATLPIFAGLIRVSLDRCELRMHLTGCKIPLSARAFVVTAPLSVKTERSVQTSREESMNRKRSRSIIGGVTTNAGSFEGQVENEDTDSQGESTVVSTSFIVNTATVSASGGDNSPIWTFRALHGEPHIKGLYANDRWAVAHLTDDIATIDMQLHAADRDIDIEGVGGLWTKRLSRNKQIIRRLLVLKLLNFRSCLSRVVFDASKHMPRIGSPWS